MASKRHADSRRLYSWWWDSHISPKNSKWLQDNLSDMDMKIKAMIKLIEEDADSFARRAEMYYKKRPELMRLVEEFYRAYRALAERYDHATGALRQAHRTIAEAFPNQIPTFSDEFSPTSSTTDAEYTFGSGDSPMDPYGSSPQFSNGKGNGIYSDDGDSWVDRKGLKQMGGIFASQDANLFSNASEKKIKKSLNFSDDGMDTTQVKSLQEKISQLSSENESLKLEVNLKSEKSSDLENQVKQMQEAHAKLDSQKEDAILQFQECLQRVVELEAQIEVFRKVNADLLVKVESLSRNEEMCHLLEKDNQYLNMKVDTLIKEANFLQEDYLNKKEEIENLKGILCHEQSRTAEAELAVKNLEQLQIQSQVELKSSRLEVQHGSQLLKEMESMKKTLEEDINLLKEENHSLCIELKQKREEMNRLNIALQNECKRSIEIEAKFQSLESLHGQSQNELKHLMLDLQSSMHDLKEVEMRKQFLVEELGKIKEDIQMLNEKNTSLMTMINSLQTKILCLIDVQEQLKNKVALHSDENNTMQRDITSMKEEINNLQLRNRTIADQIQAVGFDEESFQVSVTCLQNDNLELKESCKRHESEKLLLFERLAHMDQISEKNTALETSLSDTTVELKDLREEMIVVQQSHNSLQEANASLLSEKNSLILKVENIEGHVEELAKKKLFLECSLSDANAELEGLRRELKNMEESYQSLYNDKCYLDVERNTLLSKVENMGLSLENLKKRYELLHDEHLVLENEKEKTRKQLIDLQDIFNQEKQDHKHFKQCSNAKLAVLESNISKLNESNLTKEEQFRNEQHKLFGLEVERFILQRCISDLINGNRSLQDKCQELEHDNMDHKEKNMMLSSANGRLVMEMQMILKALAKDGCNDTHGEESYLQNILDSIRELQNSVFATKNEHLALCIESSINDILFKEIACSAAELQSNNRTLELDNMDHKEKNMTLSSVNGRLVMEMQMILKALTKEGTFTHGEESCLQNILDNIRELQNSVHATKNEHLALLIESSINDVLFNEIACSAAELQSNNRALEQDNMDHKEKNMMLSSVNGRLVMEMQMILKALTKEGGTFTHGEESCLQNILANIRELQNSVHATKNEHLALMIESSINDILFKEIACSAADLESNNKTLEQMYRLRTDELFGLQAERCNLLESNKHLEQNLEASYQTEKVIKEKLEILGTKLLASEEAEFMLRDNNSGLVQEISSLSSQLCGLGKERDILEEEINAVLQENVALDCVSVMLKHCKFETSLKLKALLDDFRCTTDSKNHLAGKVKELNETMQVIEDENTQLKNLLSKIEEFKSHTVLLAVELSMANSINNDMNLQEHRMNQQIERTEKLLTEKQEALLEVCMILQKLQKVEEKLLCNLKETKLELDNANCTKDSLESKINMLSEAIISKDNDSARSLEANATLVLELEKLQKENVELKINNCNLHKDINCCEDEVTTMLNEFQIATVHAEVYEDKLLELMGDYEDVAVNNMVLRGAVNNEVAIRDAQIEKLNREVYDLKGQNTIMRAELDDYMPVIGSLQKSLSDLESLVISSQKGDNSKGFRLDSSCDRHPTNFVDKGKGIFELEKLQKKVETIREVLGHHMGQYVVHSLDPSEGQHMDQYVVHGLDPTGQKYGDRMKDQEEKPTKSEEYATMDRIEQVDKTEETEDGLQYAKVSSNKDDLIMKDIQLDHASSPPRFERETSLYNIVGNDVTQTDDRMLELWKTDEWDYGGNSGKASEDSWNYTRHDGEGGRNAHPSSEVVVEKELGVDKLAMPKRKKENRQDWNKVLERLSSDAQRLTTLEAGVLELKNKVETSVKMHPKNYEYNDIRGQLQDAEENILQLLDTNKKLIEKAEVSTNNFAESEPMNQRWRQVSGRARRGSEKIGRLELELQKLQYIFLKLKELDNQKTKAIDKRSSVLLRDYLYGSDQGRKKNLYLCCFKPKTKGH